MEKYKFGYVSIIGRPNVGKSTLLNKIIGKKISIILPRPQTTRSQIRGILTTEKFQMVFFDTPGYHKPLSRLGEHMVEYAQESIKSGDVTLWMVEAHKFPQKEDEILGDYLKKFFTFHTSKTLFLILNKIDLCKERLEEIKESYLSLGNFKEVIGLSALKGEEFGYLLERISFYLPEGEALYPADNPQNSNFFCSEVIREKASMFTRCEVPYSIAVETEEIRKGKGTGKEILYIRANIYVEKKSHKGILIGKGGERLKKIASLAREELEEFFSSKIYLDLWVKTKPKWKEKEEFLRVLGY